MSTREQAEAAVQHIVEKLGYLNRPDVVGVGVTLPMSAMQEGGHEVVIELREGCELPKLQLMRVLGVDVHYKKFKCVDAPPEPLA